MRRGVMAPGSIVVLWFTLCTLAGAQQLPPLEAVDLDQEPVFRIQLDAAHANPPSELLVRQLVRTKMPLGVWEKPWTAAGLAQTDLLWIGAPQTEASPAAQFAIPELVSLAKFVADGGSLVITGPAGSEAYAAITRLNALLVTVGAQVRFGSAESMEGAGYLPGQVVVPPGRAQDAMRPLLLWAPTALILPPRGVAALLTATTPAGAAIVVGSLEKVGRGQVAVFGAPLVYTDSSPAENDNLPFVEDLAIWLADWAAQYRS